MSPRIKDIPGPYRLYFVSADCSEPPHIHVVRERKRAKFWLEPIALFSQGGFRAHELREIERFLRERHSEIMEAWHEHCG